METMDMAIRAQKMNPPVMASQVATRFSTPAKPLGGDPESASARSTYSAMVSTFNLCGVSG
jgi:hypothetical protein